MPTEFQVTFDARDAQALARFWSAAMGYELEDHHDQIEQVLAAGQASEADTVMIDGRRSWRGMAAARDGSGQKPRLLFVEVPEGKTAKNRVHLDLHVEDRAATVAACLAAGATKLWDAKHPFTWVTLADPEGNEFCIA